MFPLGLALSWGVWAVLSFGIYVLFLGAYFQ